MDFWGVEVVAGKPLEVEFGDHSYLHVSQAALGESKGGKGADERVVLRAQVGEQEIVIGTLVAGKCDQISFDLIFDKGFKLSHNNKAHSVYFCGYTSESPDEEYFSSDEEEGEDEDVEEIEPAEEAKLNGKPGKDKKANAAASTVEAAKAAQDAKKVGSKGSAPGIALKAEKKKPNVVEEKSESEEDEDESEEDDDDEDDDEYDEDMEDIGDQLDLSEDSEDEEDEEDTPNLKKRTKPSIGAAQTPESGKKQKLSKPTEGVKPGVITTPGKKSGVQKAVTTPAAKEQKTPTQNSGKTPGKQAPSSNGGKTPKQQNTPGAKKSPLTLGQYSCTPCSRNFTSESALAQHKTAKHKDE